MKHLLVDAVAGASALGVGAVTADTVLGRLIQAFLHQLGGLLLNRLERRADVVADGLALLGPLLALALEGAENVRRSALVVLFRLRLVSCLETSRQRSATLRCRTILGPRATGEDRQSTHNS